MKFLTLFTVIIGFALLQVRIKGGIVPDGGTTIINGTTTNLIGDVRIGSNGTFTSVLVFGGGKVTNRSDQANGINTSTVYIGYNSSARSNRVVVGGVSSIWRSEMDFYVGYIGSYNLLQVTNGGKVSNLDGTVGVSVSSSNNTALISGPGAAWTNINYLTVGANGSLNSLIVSNSGWTGCDGLTIGAGGLGGDRNTVIVDGNGSAIDVSDNPGSPGVVDVGAGGTNNLLILTNGGVLSCSIGRVGAGSEAGNVAIVTGGNSKWLARMSITVGSHGANSDLIITNFGSVSASNVTIGTFSDSTGNRLLLAADSSLLVNDGNPRGTTEIRRGTLTVNSGSLVTYALLLTNGSDGLLDFKGGFIRVAQATVSNGLPLIVGNGTLPAQLELNRGTNVIRNGLRVSNNALLTGSGMVIGDITNHSGGTLAQGFLDNLVTRLIIGGNLTMADGSTNRFKLFKATRTNDLVVISNKVTFGGVLAVANQTGILANRDSFKLFNAGSYSGAFGVLDPSTPGPGLRWSTNGLPIDGVLRIAANPSTSPTIATNKFLDGTNLVLTVTNGVPYEPVYLLTSDNVAQSLSQWTSILTNRFGATGLIVISNKVDAIEPQRYYAIRVN